MRPTRRFRVGADRFGTCLAGALACLAGAILATGISLARADQIEMQNGDRYNGKVLSLTNDTMVLQSDMLGKIVIPRAKVAKISLGTNATMRLETNTTPKAVAIATNSAGTAVASLRSSGVSAQEAEKVKQQFLADADPAAKAKYDEMLGDLLSGKMSLGDLRAQAKSAADQLRGFKKELGSETDPTLDSYLAILESFLKEVPATEPVTRTNLQHTLRKSSSDKED